jgi:hypothetical protein
MRLSKKCGMHFYKMERNVTTGRIQYLLTNVDDVNEYFAYISFDQVHNELTVIVNRPNLDAVTSFQQLCAYRIEAMLRNTSWL